MSVSWRRSSCLPDILPATAVIAVRDEASGAWYLLGLHMMTERQPGVWVDKDTDAGLYAADFWWLPEEELLATLP